MADQLRQIGALMEMQVGASQARLRQIKLREEKLLHYLGDLDQYLTATTNRGTVNDTIAFQNDVQLRRWVDHRRASVNGELAQVRALIAMAQKDLARHFARKQAADKLTERVIEEARKTATQRQTY